MLQKQLEDSMASGADGQERLKMEIKRLMDEIEELKIKARKDFQDLEFRLNK